MKLQIAVLPGDSIGPEVTEQAIKVLKAIAFNYNHKFNFNYADVGAIASDKFQQASSSRKNHMLILTLILFLGVVNDFQPLIKN